MVDAVGLRDVREVIEDDRRGHALEDGHDLHDLGGRRVDLDVPAEIVDALREGLHHLGRRGAGLRQVEADAADSEVVHALELVGRDLVVDDRDHAGLRAERRQRLEMPAVVRAVGRRLHENVAGRADALLERAIVLDQRVGRPQGGLRIDRELCVVDVVMAVGGVGGRLQLRRLGAHRPLDRLGGRRARGNPDKRRRRQALQHFAPIPGQSAHCILLAAGAACCVTRAYHVARGRRARRARPTPKCTSAAE